MYKDLHDVYAKHLHKDVGVDLFRQIQTFRINLAQKNEHYIDFLGNNTTGTQASKIRFSQLDENMLFADVLEIDRDQLQYDLWDTKDIEKKNKVGSNATYLTLVYIIHKYTISKDIGKYRDDAIRELYYIFGYKVVSSIFSAWWKFDTEPTVAKAVTERNC